MKDNKLLKLFTTMFVISSVTFGGGFVIVTFMKNKFVEKLHWIDEKEMLDIVAIAQSSPGAIAVNAAIQVGWKMEGFPGMLVAVLGTIIPPMGILIVISLFYDWFITNPYISALLRGMQAGVAAVVLSVALELGGKVIKEHDIVRILLMAIAFIAGFFLNVNVILLIVAAAFLGIVLYFLESRRIK